MGLMHRFFVTPEVLAAEPVTLTGGLAHQICHVLRMHPGDRVILLDNRGWAYEAAVVSCTGQAVTLEVRDRQEATGEPRTHITLLQAVLKGERFAWALQKGTEVGVSRFVPLICERTVSGDQRALEHKRERWERIIREAAEQSRRARLPVLAPVQPFEVAVQAGRLEDRPHSSCSLRLLLWEGAGAAALREVLAACNLRSGGRIEVFVGPEGGFTDRERDMARTCGIVPVTLGPRILRAETAGLVAAAAILYEAEGI